MRVKLAAFVASLIAAIGLLSQVPNPPSGLGAATGSITVMIGGQVVGSAPALNFLADNTLWHCMPDAALNSIDCSATADSATFLTKNTDQAFSDHVVTVTLGPKNVYAGNPVPSTAGIIEPGSLWVIIPNVTMPANAVLDLGGGPQPIEKISAGAAVPVTGGECVGGVPCLVVAMADAFVVH